MCFKDVLILHISLKAHSPLLFSKKWPSTNDPRWCPRKLAFLDTHPSLYLSLWTLITPNFRSLAVLISSSTAFSFGSQSLQCSSDMLAFRDTNVLGSPHRTDEHSQHPVEELLFRLWRKTVRCTEAQAPLHNCSMTATRPLQILQQRYGGKGYLLM